MRLARLLPVVFLCASCVANEPTDSSSSEDAIVGGNLEPTRYPEMGYLVYRLRSGPHAGEIFRPDCGATLIAPKAVVTAGHCAKSSSLEPEVVAVGFGDGLTGPTYGVVGTRDQWVYSGYEDVAVIELDRSVEGLTPMPLARRELPRGTHALVIGYGRVEAGGTVEELDSFDHRSDHRERYPGLRKSSDHEITKVNEFIEAYPLPDTATRKSGGICYADSGSALILDDGTIAGVLAHWPNYVTDCQTNSGGWWTNLQKPEVATFITMRLEDIGSR